MIKRFWIWMLSVRISKGKPEIQELAPPENIAATDAWNLFASRGLNLEQTHDALLIMFNQLAREAGKLGGDHLDYFCDDAIVAINEMRGDSEGISSNVTLH